MRDVEKGKFSVRNAVLKLKSGLKVEYEVDVILKFHLATTGDPDYVVDVSLVKLRHRTIVLARDFLPDLSQKKTGRVQAHLAANGDSSYLFVKFTVKSEDM